jgi:D-3-phosphoglycerate dehydrogenase
LGPESTLEHVRASLPRDFEIRLVLDETNINEVIRNCDVILDAYMRIHFRADRINTARQLKLYVTATTGADHVDASALAKRGIPLLTLQGQRELLRNLTPAAEHSWLLLMACARHLRGAIQDVLGGKWDRNKYPGIMLRNKTLGIIGCGRIGEWMSRYASAFRMNCLGYDPYVDPWPGNIEKSNLEPLLMRSDFISLHVPLNEETRGLLGSKEFILIKQGAVLINTSRGEVIDESALLSGLLEGRLAAVGLDVLTQEPDIANHPLVEYARAHDNLIITPHIGGYSPDALRYVLSFSCRRIVEFFGM